MSLVEAIARGILRAVPFGYGMTDAESRDYARACLEAIEREGYVVVPKEPTEEMVRAGMSPFMAAHDPFYNKNEPCGPIYRAMLAAAKQE